MKKWVFFSLLVICLGACKKAVPISDFEITGTVRDYTGRLDGCSMMIELDNGKLLEIHSLPQSTVLIVNKKVAIRYTVATNVFSACMAGEIADISSLRYL